MNQAFFRAGCNSLPAVKPASRKADPVNSGADSIVWMKEEARSAQLRGFDVCSEMNFISELLLENTAAAVPSGWRLQSSAGPEHTCSGLFILLARRRCMVEEQNYMRRAIRLAKQRHTLGQSQSSGGSGDCEKRPCHQEKAAMPAAADARRARRPGSLYRRPCRGYRLCYAGAMLPPGPTASLHAGADRKRRCPGGGWFPGPQPKGGGQGYRAAARCRRGSGKKIFLRRECDALNPVFSTISPPGPPMSL